MPAVTRRSNSTRAARKQEVTSALLKHVERLLKNESWNSLTVERICAESGVARSSFYLFFEDQEHLLVVLAERGLELIVESGQGWFCFPRHGTREDLVEAVQAMFTTYHDHAPILSAVFEAASYDEQIREQFRDTMERAYLALTNHIRDAQADGWIRPDLSAEHVAHWLSWMGETGLRWMLGRQERPTRKMVQAYCDIVWDTLYAERP